jgi:hypothetical protein
MPVTPVTVTRLGTSHVAQSANFVILVTFGGGFFCAVAAVTMTHIGIVGMSSIVDLVSLVSRPASSILRLATLGRCPS